MTGQGWVDYPRVVLSTDLGEITAAFTDAGHVHVSTDHGHYGQPAQSLELRDVSYSISLHLYAVAGDDGITWEERGRDAYVSRRDDYSIRPVATTFVAKMVKACTDAVTGYTAQNPEVLDQAEYAAARQALHRLERELADARAKLRELEDQHTAQVDRMVAAQLAIQSTGGTVPA